MASLSFLQPGKIVFLPFQRTLLQRLLFCPAPYRENPVTRRARGLRHSLNVASLHYCEIKEKCGTVSRDSFKGLTCNGELALAIYLLYKPCLHVICVIGEGKPVRGRSSTFSDDAI